MRFAKFALMVGMFSVAESVIAAAGLEEELPPSIGSSSGGSPQKLTREELRLMVTAKREAAARAGQPKSLKPLKREVREKTAAFALAKETSKKAGEAAAEKRAAHQQAQQAREEAEKVLTAAQKNLEAAQKAKASTLGRVVKAKESNSSAGE